MPRHRATKGGGKRPSPVMPEGDEERDIDMERRKEKVRTLIQDFKTEMNSRMQCLETIVTEIQKQIDVTFSMEMMKITPFRHMKLIDFLKEGGKFEEISVDGSVHDQLRSLRSMLEVNGSKPENTLSTIDELNGEPVTGTLKKNKRSRKTNKDQGPPPTTSRRGKPRVSSTCATPTTISSLSQWGTPLITPKFDPRLFKTPAAVVGMRVAKPGELLVSMEGSPVMHADKRQGVVIQINDNKSIIVPTNGDISSMDIDDIDSLTLQSAMSTLQKMQAKLDAVVNCSVK